ncbi:MAG: TonB-dependent receptor [Prevotellaceae bacterium]|jgi:outer membrane receptor for ferrienterochelin and colicin|nr:TonB-dependent receptor [Prevotellaceae bacterium]
MKKISIAFCLLAAAASGGFAQGNAPATPAVPAQVSEYYFGAPLLKVLEDFERKYGFALRYDSALVAKYRYTHDYMGTERQLAFDIIFRETKELSYYVDGQGVYCIVLAKNLPKNRTRVENKRYEGAATRQNLTVTGRIKDRTNGEFLPFATVSVEGSPTIATATNTDGYFTLYNVPSDRETLVFRYLGYETQRFYLSPEIKVDNLFVELDPAINAMDEVVVVSEREDVLRVPEQSIGVIQTTAAKIADLPALGEKDLFRTFQLMPGISAANESSAGMYVRGGTPDQNLVLYDGFTIYHQEHLMGVFSAFNTNAVKDVQLHKGGFEARHGGRLSSVMEIVGKTGNDKALNVGGDVGFLGFNAFVETPFGNEKGSLFVAGRRSFQSFMYDKFTDVYTESAQPAMGRPGGGRFNQRNRQKPESYFYDLNAKATFNPTRRDVVALSFFNGEDALDNSRESFGSPLMSGSITDKTSWGNVGSSLKWSRRWSNKLYTNLLASFSSYYSLRDRQNSASSSGSSSAAGNVAVMFDQNTGEHNTLRDYSLKLDGEYRISGRNKLEFGLTGSAYKIAYRYAQNDTASILNMQRSGTLLGVYAQDRWRAGDRLTVLPGIRLSRYGVTSRIYAEPRLQAFYKISDRLSLKASTGYYSQFVNRIVREDVSAGSRDIWLLSDDEGIPVSRSLHLVAGASYETNGYLFDVEAYAKNLYDLSEYTLRFAPSLTGNSGYREFFYSGRGYSRGVDFLAQKKFGMFTGWVGYTLSETRYRFAAYGDGYFPANQDVTHELKTVLTCKPGRNLTLSATWIYATGKPFTEPAGGYTLGVPNGGEMSFIVVDGKNNARYPDYHRLDLLAKYDLAFIKPVKASISVSLFNVYDRANVWYREYAYDEDSGITATNINLLGFTPNVTLSIQLR